MSTYPNWNVENRKWRGFIDGQWRDLVIVDAEEAIDIECEVVEPKQLEP